MSKNFVDGVMGLTRYYSRLFAKLTMINIFHRVVIRP
jgi:hypothetical protein